jgi:hypothetical protein
MNYLSVHYSNHLRPTTYKTVANPSGKKHLTLLLGIPNAYDRFCTGRPLDNSSIAKLIDAKDWCMNVDAFLASTI